MVPSYAASHVRRRLQAAEPSEATAQKLQNAWDAAVLKLAGDAADCVNKFFPASDSGTVTAEMHANQDKLLDSLKHFPFFGALASVDEISSVTCTCDTGFSIALDFGMDQCQCDSDPNCPAHTPCDYPDSDGCIRYTSTACTSPKPPTEMLVNLAEAGASHHLFNEATRVARGTG